MGAAIIESLGRRIPSTYVGMLPLDTRLARDIGIASNLALSARVASLQGAFSRFRSSRKLVTAARSCSAISRTLCSLSFLLRLIMSSTSARDGPSMGQVQLTATPAEQWPNVIDRRIGTIKLLQAVPETSRMGWDASQGGERGWGANSCV